jgi:hypothetical protein
MCLLLQMWFPSASSGELGRVWLLFCSTGGPLDWPGTHLSSSKGRPESLFQIPERCGVGYCGCLADLAGLLRPLGDFLLEAGAMGREERGELVNSLARTLPRCLVSIGIHRLSYTPYNPHHGPLVHVYSTHSSAL